MDGAAKEDTEAAADWEEAATAVTITNHQADTEAADMEAVDTEAVDTTNRPEVDAVAGVEAEAADILVEGAAEVDLGVNLRHQHLHRRHRPVAVTDGKIFQLIIINND